MQRVSKEGCSPIAGARALVFLRRKACCLRHKARKKKNQIRDLSKFEKAVSSMEERLTTNQEVVGSTPIRPELFYGDKLVVGFFSTFCF